MFFNTCRSSCNRKEEPVRVGNSRNGITKHCEEIVLKRRNFHSGRDWLTTVTGSLSLSVVFCVPPQGRGIYERNPRCGGRKRRGRGKGLLGYPSKVKGLSSPVKSLVDCESPRGSLINTQSKANLPPSFRIQKTLLDSTKLLSKKI